MKTTVIILALSFVCVSLVNAQNNTTKSKSQNKQAEIVIEDGFITLMANSPFSTGSENMNLDQMKRTKQNLGNQLRFSNQRVLFRESGKIICCFHPTRIEQYNPLKEN